MPFNIGPGELILILIIALVVLGPGKLPDVAASLGKSVREFRKAATDITDAGKLDAPAPASPSTTSPTATAEPTVAPPAATTPPAAPAAATLPPAGVAPPPADAGPTNGATAPAAPGSDVPAAAGTSGAAVGDPHAS